MRFFATPLMRKPYFCSPRLPRIRPGVLSESAFAPGLAEVHLFGIRMPLCEAGITPNAGKVPKKRSQMSRKSEPRLYKWRCFCRTPSKGVSWGLPCVILGAFLEALGSHLVIFCGCFGKASKVYVKSRHLACRLFPHPFPFWVLFSIVCKLYLLSAFPVPLLRQGSV